MQPATRTAIHNRSRNILDVNLHEVALNMSEKNKVWPSCFVFVQRNSHRFESCRLNPLSSRFNVFHSLLPTCSKGILAVSLCTSGMSAWSRYTANRLGYVAMRLHRSWWLIQLICTVASCGIWVNVDTDQPVSSGCFTIEGVSPAIRVCEVDKFPRTRYSGSLTH